MTENSSKALDAKVRCIESKIKGDRKLIDGYIDKIAAGKKEYVNACICSICRASNGFSCAFSHADPEEECAGKRRGKK